MDDEFETIKGGGKDEESYCPGRGAGFEAVVYAGSGAVSGVEFGVAVGGVLYECGAKLTLVESNDEREVGESELTEGDEDTLESAEAMLGGRAEGPSCLCA